MVSCILAESGAVVGSTVSVETVHGVKVEGIALSMDFVRNILILHTNEPALAKPLIRLFNTEHVKSIKLVKKPDEHDLAWVKNTNEHLTARNPLPTKARERYNKTLAEVAPLLMKQSGVSLRGQQAYLQLKRTIDDTRWSGEDIRVLGIVTVRKPYGPNDVTKDGQATGIDESRVNTTIAQIQKILSKPFTEYKTRHPLDFTLPVNTAAAAAQ